MIGYSVESDKIITLLENKVETSTSEIIHDLVSNDIISKNKEDMRNAQLYYDVENPEITNKSFNKIKIADKDVTLAAPNSKVKHPYFFIAVNQKVGYINHPQFQSEDDKVLETIDTVLNNDDFPDLVNDWETGTSVNGIEYLHPYLNNEGELSFVIFDAVGMIPIFDTRFEKELVSALRYYVLTHKKDEKTEDLHAVEIYKKDSVEFWQETEQGKYKRINELFYLTAANTKAGETGLVWGKLPIIPLFNNTKKRSDLKLAKDLIDDYDLHKSAFSNELQSVKEALLFLTGFSVSGTSQAEIKREWEKLLTNMKVLNMLVAPDSEASLQSIKNEVAHQAKDSHLDRTRAEIFTSLMAVDPNMVGDGNITNIVLKARYLLLDMKSTLLIAKLIKSLRTVLYFVNRFAELKGLATFDPKEIQITITKNVLINETEDIQNITQSLLNNTMSRETGVTLNPYINDSVAELERLEAEQKNEAEQFDQEQTFIPE